MQLRELGSLMGQDRRLVPFSSPSARINRSEMTPIAELVELLETAPGEIEVPDPMTCGNIARTLREMDVRKLSTHLVEIIEHGIAALDACAHHQVVPTRPLSTGHYVIPWTETHLVA